MEFEFDTFFTAMKKPAVLGEGGEVFEKIRIALDDAINEGISERIKSRLINELLYIKQNGFITSKIVESISNVSASSAKRDISLLKKLEIIKFEGSRKTGAYVLTAKGKEVMN